MWYIIKEEMMYLLKSLLIILVLSFANVITAKLSELINSAYSNVIMDVANLTSDIVSKLDAGSCFTFIVDTQYEDVLYTKSFESGIVGKSYYIIKISDAEDLLSPNYATVKTLMEVRKAGCQMYVTLLANGIQMRRFLVFGDKYRIINTRVNYVILHDYRLFTRQYNYIWKRIINVLFIRELEMKRGETKRSKSNLFELSTVPFPLPLGDIFVARRVDIWSNGKYNTGEKLFRDKMSNMGRHILQAAVIEHTPAVSKSQIGNITVYNGLEIEIIKSLAANLNFSYEIYEAKDSVKEKWGNMLSNGSFTGLLGEIVDREADFALGDLYYTQYHLELMDLSIPYFTECLTFLTPESSTDNAWKTLILPFKSEMWAGAIVCVFSIGIVISIIGKLYNHFKNASRKINIESSEKIEINVNQQLKHLTKLRLVQNQQISNDIFDTLENCILYTYSMTMVVSLPRIPKAWSLRLLTGWYWIYSVLIVVAYRASMTAILANPAPKVTIDTLEQLAETTSVKCGAWGKQNKLFFLSSQDTAGQQIGAKMELVTDVNRALDQIVHGSFAYYDNEYYLKQIRSLRPSEVEQQTLHIMRECAIHMPVSIGLKKNSPIKPHIDKVIRTIIESGLANKWLSDAILQYQSNIEMEPPEAVMDLKKLYGGFVALAIGVVIGVAVLTGEILYFRCVTQRKPSYDKLITCT